MAPNVTLHFFPANDLNGSLLHEITDEDSYFRGLKLIPQRDGLGGGEMLLARKVGFAGFGTGTFFPEVFVRVLVHAYSDTTYYPWGFFLTKRNQIVVERDEDGGEVFRFGGAGPKQYLDRAALGIGGPSTGWNLDLVNGVWRWGESATVGTILQRIIAQDANLDDPALPDLTHTFDDDDDSASVAWADTDLSGAEDQYQIPIGTSLLTSLNELDDVVELTSWVELGTVASPKFELNVKQGLGADKTGSAFGAGVCLLKEGVNVADEAITLEGASLKKASHVFVEGADGFWAVAERPSFSPGDYVKYAKIEYTRSNREPWLQKAGIRWLQRQDYGEKELTIEIVPGASDSTGLYFPAPDRNLWLSNLISVDTTEDGAFHTPLDIQPSEDQLVTGFELDLGPAGDTATADKKAKSWDVKVILNKERPGTIPKAPDQRSSVTGPRCCAPFPHECPASPGDTLLTETDDSGWLGTLATGDGFTGQYRQVGGSGGTSMPAATVSGLSPGDYSITVRLGGSEHKYTGKIQLRDSTAVNPAIDITFPNAVRAPGGHGSVTGYSEAFELPTGYDRIRYFHASKMGGWRYQAEIYALAAPPEPGEECIPDGSGGDPTDPLYPFTVHYNDPRFTATDQHPTTKFSQTDAENTSGGDLGAGDSVVPDLTTEGAVTTTSDAAQILLPVGIVTEGIEDGEEGTVVWAGFVSEVTLTGSASPGDFLYTSTTPGALDAAGGDPTEGAVGVVLATDSGVPIAVRWWGIPLAGTGSGVTAHSALTGLSADDHSAYLTVTGGGGDTVNTVAASGSTETLDLATGNFHDVTLSANCTLTLTGATNGVACQMMILLRQGTGAPWTVTWPGSVSWVGGSAPTLQTALNAWDIVTLVTRDGGTVWFGDASVASGGGGAPTTADYLVGTAQGGLSAEIVVGTSPGGELGGTWASPTVDGTHSGSAHHAQTHATAHSDGGADAVDVADLDGYPGGTSTYLRADGTFANPGGGSGGSTIGPGRPFISGGATAYILPGYTFASIISTQLPLGTRYYLPFYVQEEIDVVALMVECTLGAAAGREYRGGLYEADSQYVPGALLFEGAFNLATTGVKTVAPGGGPITLPPGYYLTCMESGHATPTLRTWQLAGTLWASTGSANALVTRLVVAGTTYGALPDPGTAPTSMQLSNVPAQARILLQVNV